MIRFQFPFRRPATVAKQEATKQEQDQQGPSESRRLYEATQLATAALRPKIRGSVMCHRTFEDALERAAAKTGYPEVDCLLRTQVLQQLWARGSSGGRRFTVDYSTGNIRFW